MLLSCQSPVAYSLNSAVAYSLTVPLPLNKITYQKALFQGNKREVPRYNFHWKETN